MMFRAYLALHDMYTFERQTKVYRTTWQALSEVAQKGHRTIFINGFPYAAWRIWFATSRGLEQLT